MLGIGLSLTAVSRTSTFHPTQLPGLVALYDISDLSSLFVERTGASASTPASVDGVVGTVLDLSGQGNHVTAPSDAARPILRESNGLYWLEGDGVDDRLRSVLPDAVVSDTWFVSAALSAANLKTGARVLFGVSNSNPNATRTGFCVASVETHCALAKPTNFHRLGCNFLGQTTRVVTLFGSGVYGVARRDGLVSDEISDLGSSIGGDIHEIHIFGSSSILAGRFYGGLVSIADLRANQTDIESWIAERGGVTL